MMFGQQPYVYQQPIYNQPIGQPISQPMQEQMMRPQYQPAPQMPAYQPQPQQPQNQSIIWIPNEQAAQNKYLVSTLRPSPSPAYVVANPYCCNSGYNYGCGNCA